MGSNSEFEKLRASVSFVKGLLTPDEERFLYETAKRAQKGGEIVEIGSLRGRSTVFLAKGSEQGAGLTVHAIDPHFETYMHQGTGGIEEDTYQEFLNNIEKSGVKHLVHPIRKTSEDASVGWNKPVSFLWIDGDHRYEGVKKDVELFWPHVIEGGFIGFHDSTYKGVKKLMKELLRKGGYSDITLTDSITCFTKATGQRNAAKARRMRMVMASYAAVRTILPDPVRAQLKKLKRPVMRAIGFEMDSRAR